MADDTRIGLLLVGGHGTSFQATRLRAVMAGRGHGLLVSRAVLVADNQPYIAPGFVFLQAVEGVAGTDARLAAGAGVEIYLKGVLLAGRGLRKGDELAVEFLVEMVIDVSMFLGKALDHRQRTLLGEQAVDEGFLGGIECCRSVHEQNSVCRALRSCRVVKA